MNIIELANDSGLVYYGMGKDRARFIHHLENFSHLVAAQEREAWEHKFARLHQLMDIREIQPNKPCCLAARADEREECAKLCETTAPSQINGYECANVIRARGTI
jgi:hypothetical protein